MRSYFLTFLYVLIYFSPVFSKITGKKSKHGFVPLAVISMDHGYYSLFIENSTDKDPDATATFIGLCDLKTLQYWSPCPFDDPSGRCCPGGCRVHRKSYDFESIVSKPQCNCNGSLENRQLLPIPDYPTCFLGGQCLNAKCTVASRNARKLPSLIYNCILNNAKHGDSLQDVRRSPHRAFSEGRNRVKRREITSSPVALQFRTKCINKLGRCTDFNCRQQGDPCCSPGGRKCKRSVSQTDYLSQKHMNELRFERESNNALTRILRAVSRKRHSRSPRRSRLSRRATSEESVQDDDDDDDDDFGEDSGGEDIAIEEDETIEKPETDDNPEKDEIRQEQRQEMLKTHNLTGDEVGDLNSQRTTTVKAVASSSSNSCNESRWFKLSTMSSALSLVMCLHYYQVL